VPYLSASAVVFHEEALYQVYGGGIRSNVCHSSCACNAQIQRTGGQWQSAEYSTFSISDEAGKYQLSVSGYSGDSVDAMAGNSNANNNADGMKFSTPDQDNDLNPSINRAAIGGGGWWFGDWSNSRINGYRNGRWRLTIEVTDVQFSRMLVRAN